MNFVVDASVVVKWLVSETLTEEARLLLSHRLKLHAPELLLAEYANVIWVLGRARGRQRRARWRPPSTGMVVPVT